MLAFLCFVSVFGALLVFFLGSWLCWRVPFSLCVCSSFLCASASILVAAVFAGDLVSKGAADYSASCPLFGTLLLLSLLDITDVIPSKYEKSVISKSL